VSSRLDLGQAPLRAAQFGEDEPQPWVPLEYPGEQELEQRPVCGVSGVAAAVLVAGHPSTRRRRRTAMATDPMPPAARLVASQLQARRGRLGVVGARIGNFREG
jgi:hypothetical protein